MRLTVAYDVIRLVSMPRETTRRVGQPLAHPWQTAGTKITIGTELWLAALLFCDICKGGDGRTKNWCYWSLRSSKRPLCAVLHCPLARCAAPCQPRGPCWRFWPLPRKPPHPMLPPMQGLYMAAQDLHLVVQLVISHRNKACVNSAWCCWKEDFDSLASNKCVRDLISPEGLGDLQSGGDDDDAHSWSD